MALVTGARGTDATRGVGSDQLKIDMADAIYRLEPNNTPLVLLASELNRMQATQPVYKHLEDAREERYSRVNNGGGYTSAQTSIVVDDGTAYQAGDMVRVYDSGEIMRVTAVSTNTLTVTRSWGATAATALTDNDYLYRLGDTNAENADVRDPKSTTPTTVTGYTEIFRDSFGVSDTADNVEYYGETELTRQQVNKGLEHADRIERQFFFGEAVENTSGNYPIRSTGGLNSLITSNVETQAALTETEFDTFLRTAAFLEGSDEKWLFCSGILTQALMTWAKSKVEMSVEETTYGIDVLRYISPFGALNVRTHRGLEKMGFDGTIIGGIGFVVDPGKIGYKHIANRDTQLLTNRQGRGVDGVVDEYLTECGLWLANESCHAILNGITSFS